MTLTGLAVACPECGCTIPIPVIATISDPDDAGWQRPLFEPDYTDIWAHNLAHAE